MRLPLLLQTTGPPFPILGSLTTFGGWTIERVLDETEPVCKSWILPAQIRGVGPLSRAEATFFFLSVQVEVRSDEERNNHHPA